MSMYEKIIPIVKCCYEKISYHIKRIRVYTKNNYKLGVKTDNRAEKDGIILINSGRQKFFIHSCSKDDEICYCRDCLDGKTRSFEQPTMIINKYRSIDNVTLIALNETFVCIDDLKDEVYLFENRTNLIYNNYALKTLNTTFYRGIDLIAYISCSKCCEKYLIKTDYRCTYIYSAIKIQLIP